MVSVFPQNRHGNYNTYIKKVRSNSGTDLTVLFLQLLKKLSDKIQRRAHRYRVLVLSAQVNVIGGALERIQRREVFLQSGH